MAIHLEHSSSGVGALNRLELEWMDFEPPAQPELEPAAAPGVEPAAAPVTEPTPALEPAQPALPSEVAHAPAAWTESLPSAAFGPPSPAAGSPPGPSALDDLGPPAVLVTAAPADGTPAVAVSSGPTAPAMEIATLELTLADPLNQELVAAHGGALPVLDAASAGPVLQAQIERFGPDLTARLMQLHQAQAAVRNLYLGAMDEAAQNAGPGVLGAVFVPATGSHRHGDYVAEHWRFDPVAFTQAYAQAGLQEGASLAQRAFAATYGSDALQGWETYHGGDAEFTTQGHTLAGRFELTAPSHVDLDGHPNRERMGWTAASLNPDSHALRPISLQAPPDLHNAQAVWYDATMGWVTSAENVVVKQDFLDKAIPVVFIATMTWATAGAFGVAGGAGVATGTGIGAGTGVVGAMTAGAAFGAISGFYSGLMGEGKIDLGGMFRGALTGALTAGVSEHFGLNDMGVTRGLNEQGQSIVTGVNYAQRALAVTGQATLQGALQEISGGNFRDGFTAGLAQGLGAEIARGLELQINQLARGDNPSIDATQAGALRQFARVAQSAVSILANPDDPGHAFAMTFVNGLVGDVQGGLDARSLQGQGPWSDAGYRNGSDIDSDNAHDARRSEEWIGQNDAILVRRGSESEAHGTGNRSDDQFPANAPVASTPVSNSAAERTSRPADQTIVITGRRPPPGAAVDVTLPPGVTDALDITREGTPTQLLTGSAATAAMASLGVFALEAETGAAAASRVVLYLGERVVGYAVPGAWVVLGATTAYDLIQSGTQRAPGDAFIADDGQLQRYAPSDDGALVLQTQVPQQYDVPNSPEEDHTWVTVGRVTPLTDEERARMLRPTTTPAHPQGPTVMPQPIDDRGDRPDPGTPGYEAQPATPTTTTTPSFAPDWRDLLIEQSNADNNRDLAHQRYRDDPSLQNPSSLAGQTLAGVGTWGYPNTPRGTSGAEYAEQLHGVPAGLELNVGGTLSNQGIITGGAWLDGVEIRDGQTTLIDRKDWVGYPPLSENFWHGKTVNEAIRQLNAARTIGATVEWQFSTQEAANAVSDLLFEQARSVDARLTQISIRVEPKK